MLLADDKGASLIVAVGTHATLVEFLDKGRAGHGQHVPHPAARGRQAGRRQGRQPALPAAHLRLGAGGPGVGRLRRHPGGHARSLPAGRIFFTYLGAQWDASSTG